MKGKSILVTKILTIHYCFTCLNAVLGTEILKTCGKTTQQRPA